MPKESEQQRSEVDDDGVVFRIARVSPVWTSSSRITLDIKLGTLTKAMGIAGKENEVRSKRWRDAVDDIRNLSDVVAGGKTCGGEGEHR